MLLTLAFCGLLLSPQAPAPSRPAAPAVDLRARGFDHFYNLEYDEAIADFEQLAQAAPTAANWNHVAQARLYREMYRIGALESQLYGHGDPFLDEKLLEPDPAAVSVFLADNTRASDLATAALAAHPGDAHAHYDLGAAYALKGTYEFTIKKSYMPALSDAKKARHEAELAVQEEPGYLDPLIILGAHNYIAGSLPWGVKVLSSMMGYSGDQQLGRQQIATVAHSGSAEATDAEVLTVVIDRRDGLNRDAAPILESLTAQYPRNVLFAVETAETLEAAGEHEPARLQYQRILDRAAAHAPGYQRAPLDKTWYELGNLDRLFSRFPAAENDYDQAEAWPRAQPRYVQAAALAGGEVAQQEGDRATATRQFQKCVAIDPASPAGKAAQKAMGGGAAN